MSDLQDKWDKVAGEAKQKAGEVTGNADLEKDGRQQKVSGKIGEMADKASEKIADAAKDVSASAQALKEKFDKKD